MRDVTENKAIQGDVLKCLLSGHDIKLSRLKGSFP